MWFKKKPTNLPPRPDDIGEAQQSREEDAHKMEQLNAQANYVTRLGEKLIEARQNDLFGDKLQATFTRRGN